MKEQQTLKRRYRLIRIPKMSNYIFTQSTPNKLRLSSSNQLSSTTLHCCIALILLLYITSDCILSSQSFCPKYNTHSWRIHRDYNLLSLQQQQQQLQQQIHDKQQGLKQQQQQQPLYLQQRYPQTILFESTSSSSTTAQNNHNHNKRRRKATALKAIAKSSTSKIKRSSGTSKDTANDNQTKIKMNKSRSTTTTSSTTSKKQVRHSTRAKRLSSSGNIAAGAWYQRDEMMQHDILTKEDEIILGRKIVHAKKLRDDMIDLLEKKKLLSLVGEEEKEGSENSFDDHSDLYCLTDEIIYGEDKKLNECWEMKYGYDYDGITEYMDNDYHNDNDDKYDEYELNLNSYFNDINQNGHGDTSTEQITSQSRNNGKVDRRTSSTLVQDGSKLIISSIDSDLKLLSDHEVQTVLKIKGGKLELRHLLHEGAKARNKLMRSNIRLVVSIGKKWMGGNKDSGGIADRYNGSWDRPSLDEVIQEGMLGLARAVDKYDPDRGLRFSTYSTHWITSYVRQCFQAAATGCLKVPSQLHDIKVCLLFLWMSFELVSCIIYLLALICQLIRFLLFGRLRTNPLSNDI